MIFFSPQENKFNQGKFILDWVQSHSGSHCQWCWKCWWSGILYYDNCNCVRKQIPLKFLDPDLDPAMFLKVIIKGTEFGSDKINICVWGTYKREKNQIIYPNVSREKVKFPQSRDPLILYNSCSISFSVFQDMDQENVKSWKWWVWT